MANKMRDKRNKLVEIKCSEVAYINMEWLYLQVMEKLSEIAFV